MLAGDESSRLLDILGNRNRRRILQLLRLKPCFVTEISERLMISPKAVIEHLQLMEREEVLLSRCDDRRRKYYYLSRDFEVQIRVHETKTPQFPGKHDINGKFVNSLTLLREIMQSRDNLIMNLEYIDRDIDQKINELIRIGKEIFTSEGEIQLAITLANSDLSLKELVEWTELSDEQLRPMLNDLLKRKIIVQRNGYYTLRDHNDNKS